MGSPLPGDEVRTPHLPQQRQGPRITRLASSGPRQLPHAPAHFTNRSHDLAKLDEFLAEHDGRGVPAIHLISGQGGIGKTALATAWGHRVSEHFPDGQLWADLGGFSTTGPLSVPEVLGRFVRALGVPPAGVPENTDELIALYRTVTYEKPLLVLLDNAGSPEQVSPLIPASADSLVIVTSRSQLSLLQAEHRVGLVKLEPFRAAHGTEMLGRVLGESRVGAEAGVAQRIVQLCSGLPIALTTVSAKLAGRPNMPLAKVAGELESAHRRLAVLSTKEATSVQASFNLSFDALPPDAAALYTALGLHPGPEFGPGVAAAAIGARTADDLLDLLVDLGLLVERGDERYTFHDLARLHAKEKAEEHTPADRETMVRRMLEWYLHAATATGDLTTPDQRPIPYRYASPPETRVTFASREDALAWLELERANLIAAVKTADDHEMYELGWQLAAAMWPLFLLHKHYPDFLGVSQYGVKHAKLWGNRAAEALMHNRSGAATRGQGRYDEAIEHYQAGQAAAQQSEDPGIEIRSVEGVGLVALQQGRVETALQAFDSDLEISERLERPHDIGLALINRGATLTKAGRPADALDDLARARDLLGEQGDAYNVARARIELGRALAANGDFEQARTELDRAQETMRASGSQFEQARTLQALGEIAEAEGDVEAARRLYEQALPILVGLGRPEANALQARIDAL